MSSLLFLVLWGVLFTGGVRSMLVTHKDASAQPLRAAHRLDPALLRGPVGKSQLVARKRKTMCRIDREAIKTLLRNFF